MDNQSEIKNKKKANTGKIGFIGSLVVFAITSLFFIPPLIILFFAFFLLPLWLPLLIIASFCFCVHGLIKRRSRNLALTGLGINILTIILLFLTLITFTPAGTIPPPLNTYKFKRACPEAAFWLDYDQEQIVCLESLYTIILAKYGTIYYSNRPDTYMESEIIELAENNGWKYHFKIQLTKKDFENYRSNTFSEFENLAVDCIWYIQAYTRVPFAFEEDCDVLIFESGNVHGIASYILISKDKSKMEIRFTSPAVPDPAHKFWVPDQFTELHEIQSQEEEEIQ